MVVLQQLVAYTTFPASRIDTDTRVGGFWSPPQPEGNGIRWTLNIKGSHACGGYMVFCWIGHYHTELQALKGGHIVRRCHT